MMPLLFGWPTVESVMQQKAQFHSPAGFFCHQRTAGLCLPEKVSYPYECMGRRQPVTVHSASLKGLSMRRV